MRVLPRPLEFIRSSPTWIRDRSGLLSGQMIGFTALILNAGMLAMIAVLFDSPTSFRRLLQTLDFGSLLGLLLCGGAMAAVTLLVPLRQTGLFLAPRIGRYFDQIVLSGISPLRYMAGTIAAQNLFFALMLFLMLPWIVLVVAIGGMHFETFLGNLVVIWLFSVLLAVSTAAISLYVTEPLALAVVLITALVLSLISFLPISIQPGLLTPVPLLLASVPQLMILGPMTAAMAGYGAIFYMSVLMMSACIFVGLIQLHFGPLYGLIRDNSAFGEVVHSGDTRQRRRFSFRLHIQRPSEIAFFYQNRSLLLTRWEGLIRWGGGLLLLGSFVAAGCLLLAFAGTSLFGSMTPAVAGNAAYVSEMVQMLYVAGQLGTAVTAVLAILLFSRNRSTDSMPVRVIPGILLRAGTLDWLAFLMSVVGTAIVVSQILYSFAPRAEQLLQVAANASTDYLSQFSQVNATRWAVETQIIVVVSAITVYLLQRNFCLYFWSRLMAAGLTGFLWFFGLVVLPMILGLMLNERAFRIELLDKNAALGMPLALLSPLFASIARMGEAPGRLPWDVPLTGFYVLNAVLWLTLGMTLLIRTRRFRRVDDAWRAGRRNV